MPPDSQPPSGFTTRAIHSAVPPEIHQVPSSVPLYQTSTWTFDTLDDFGDVIAGRTAGHVYGRGYGNPTVEAFESVMADLEGTESAYGFDSGMAAIHAVTTTLACSGDRVVASRALYGGTHGLFHEVLPRYGIEVVLVDALDLEAVARVLPGAAMFYVETIDNPLLSVPDLTGLAALCAREGVPSVVDNTFASPYLCQPAGLGFDFVVHSATKYIGGHSDLIAGVVCCSSAHRATVRQTALELGGAMQPLEAWLCIRGLSTLALRMERHCSTAQTLAEVFEASAVVSTAYYPGLRSHPSHETARRQLRSFGGMISVELRGGLEAARRFCQALRLARIGASLGGTHTLVAHPASTTHRQVHPSARVAQGLADGLVRISVGLEDVDDLSAEVERALRAVGSDG